MDALCAQQHNRMSENSREGLGVAASNIAAFLLSAKLSDVYCFYGDVHARYEHCERLVGRVMDRVPTLVVLTPGNCAHTIQSRLAQQRQR